MGKCIGAPSTLLLAVLSSALGNGQNAPGNAPGPQGAGVPTFTIAFQRGEPVSGISSPALRLPFQCTSDGAVFISMLQLQSGVIDPRKQLLVSVAPSREAHVFRVDQVPDLYDLREVDHFASESGVVFLVEAARESNETKQGFVTSDGTKGEFKRNAAEHHFYVVTFNREGKHQKTVQIEDAFHFQHLGAFPSGTFLMYGYTGDFDSPDHPPKLALFKDDGTLIKYLQIPDGDAPESALNQGARGKGPAVFVAPVQFAAYGNSLIIVQNKTRFPLLLVSEGGGIRAVRPKLPEENQIAMLIPSDENLYARVDGSGAGSIYELDAQTGAVLKSFRVRSHESGADVACVHDGKFLSFEHGEDNLIPLVGTAEPAPSAEKRGEVVSPAN